MKSKPLLCSIRINLHGELNDQDGADAMNREASIAALGGDFEAVCQRLDTLERMHLELDGSFVFRGETDGIHIDGMIYDANGQVQYIELRGTTDRRSWQQLVSVFISGAYRNLCIQDLESGELLTLSKFEALHWQWNSSSN